MKELSLPRRDMKLEMPQLIYTRDDVPNGHRRPPIDGYKGSNNAWAIHPPRTECRRAHWREQGLGMGEFGPIFGNVEKRSPAEAEKEILLPKNLGFPGFAPCTLQILGPVL
ncbi:hypothetical protein N7540_008948 [Penicillium herquei]|nr:hypothetical protein N7540_008948 [Penicillium herquei]